MTPTPELLKEWDLKATAAAMLPSDAKSHDRVMTHRRVFANLAAQWGAAQAQAAARVQAINECALVAGGLYQHYRDLYKGRVAPVDKEHWYNPHTDGVADGASMAEDAIRALIGAKT